MKKDPVQVRWLRTPLRVLLPKLELWLMGNFPSPYPVKVSYTTKKMVYDGEETFGLCWRDGKRIRIKMKLTRCRMCMIEGLIHEWAHAHTIRHENMERRREKLNRYHDDEFHLAEGRIKRRLFDQGGRREVLEL